MKIVNYNRHPILISSIIYKVVPREDEDGVLSGFRRKTLFKMVLSSMLNSESVTNHTVPTSFIRTALFEEQIA